MMIYYINDNNIKYSSIISNSEDNKNICNTHKEDIDGLADGEEWLPY